MASFTTHGFHNFTEYIAVVILAVVFFVLLAVCTWRPALYSWWRERQEDRQKAAANNEASNNTVINNTLHPGEHRVEAVELQDLSSVDLALGARLLDANNLLRGSVVEYAQNPHPANYFASSCSYLWKGLELTTERQRDEDKCMTWNRGC
jgi:hypothetical protein